MVGKKKILLLADASRKLLVYAVIFMKNAKSAWSMVMVNVELMVMVLGTQARFPENLVKFRQAHS